MKSRYPNTTLLTRKTRLHDLPQTKIQVSINLQQKLVRLLHILSSAFLILIYTCLLPWTHL